MQAQLFDPDAGLRTVSWMTNHPDLGLIPTKHHLFDPSGVYNRGKRTGHNLTLCGLRFPRDATVSPDRVWDLVCGGCRRVYHSRRTETKG